MSGLRAVRHAGLRVSLHFEVNYGKYLAVEHFGVVFRDFDILLTGALMTLRLSTLAMVFGLVVGTLGAVGSSAGPRPIRWLIGAYVELIRNTPFLVQIFFVFFGLPPLGVRFDANDAALIAMIVNVGAYATEIIRAGIESISKGQIEAGSALGLKRFQIFRFIVLLPAMKAIFPALSSQFILLMLGSSVASTIAADELTEAANNLESRTFRSFEVYIVATLMYLTMSLAFNTLFDRLHRWLFREPAGKGAGR
jgi:polar amino acid transport system permease protein